MGFLIFPKFKDQLEAIQKYDSFKNTQKAFENDDEGLAKATARIAEAASWLPPDAVLSMAEGGMTPEDPDFKDVAFAAGKVKVKKGFGWHSVGDAISFVPKKTARGVGIFGNTIKTGAGAAYGGLKFGVRGLQVAGESGGEFINARSRELMSGDYAKAAANFAEIPLAVTGPKMGTDYAARQEAFAQNQASRFLGAIGQDDKAAEAKAKADAMLPRVSQDAFSETKAGVIGERLTAGQEVDLGQGFFVPAPNDNNINPKTGQVKSQVVATQMQRAKERGPLVGDEAGTMGRYLADTVTEPGTIAFSILSGGIDGANQVVFDPTAPVLGVVGKGAKGVNQLNNAKELAGLVNGTRKQVVAHRVEQWMTSDDGAKVVQHLADSDFTTLRKTMKGQVPASTLVKLSDAKTTQEVTDILRPILGIQVNTAPSLRGVTDQAIKNATDYTFKRSRRLTRLASLMPSSQMDLDDVDDVVTQLERVGVNAKLPQKLIDQRVEEAARATGRNGRFAAAERMSADIAEHLSSKELDSRGFKIDINGNVTKQRVGKGEVVRYGTETGRVIGRRKDGTYDVNFKRVNEAGEKIDVKERLTYDQLRSNDGVINHGDARKLARLYQGELDKARAYFVNASTGQHMDVPGALVDGSNMPLPTPHLFAENIGRTMQLPDAREIREATGAFGRFIQGRGIKVTKNGKETEIPLSVGLGKFTGGLEALTDAVVNTGWKTLALARGAYTVRVVGEEQLRMAAAKYDSLINHPISAISFITGHKGAIDMNGENFKDASKAADTLTEYAASLSQRGDYQTGRSMQVGSEDVILRADDIDHRGDYVDAWADQIRKLNADETTRIALTQGADEAKEWLWSGGGRAMREDIAEGKNREIFLTREGSDQYVDSVLERVNQMTNGNADLIKAITEGSIKGKPLRQELKTSKEFKEYLATQTELGAGPQYVAGQRTYVQGRSAKGAADTAVAWMFYNLASRPSNYLSRSSVFKQNYWTKSEEVLPWMPKVDQKKAYREAVKANLDKATLKRMKAVVDSEDFGDLALDEADLLSKHVALGKTKDLLYDAARRGQFFDSTRLVFAFGDAWKEVLTSWSKLISDDPKLIRRGQQIIAGGRSFDPDADGKGFFYQDPTTGEETFNYPLTGWFTDTFLQQNMPLSAPVKGLNIFGSVLPGVGPVVQVPAGSIIPDEPEWDGLYKAIYPMGETDRSGGFLESFLPSWMKQAGQAISEGGINEKQYNTTFMNVRAELLAGDKYDASDREDVAAANIEAKQLTKMLYFFQAGVNFGAPAASRQEFMVHDPDGNLVMMDMMKNDLSKMYEEDKKNNTNNAMFRFIDKWGPDAVYAVTPKSEQVRGYVPVTKAGRDFAREHKQLAQLHPEVYGLFAPSDGQFDITEWGRQYRGEERVPLSPEEQQKRADQLLGRALYRNAQSKVEGRTDEAARTWLKDVKKEIIADYPGYAESSFAPDKNAKDISLIEDAMKRPTFAATDAGRGFALYNEARKKALAAAKANGSDNYTQSKKTQYLRDWLNETGTRIGAEHPDFRNMWDSVLQYEVAKDTSED